MKRISDAKRAKLTGKGAAHSFAALPHYMLDSDEWSALSGHAVKLLVDLFAQFKGANNGDLSAPWSRMHRRGWRSKATLWDAIHELIEAEFIVPTRTGSKNHICALYGVTWKPIDECDGKLQVPAERVASNAWRKQKNRSLCVPEQVAMRTTEPENEPKAA